jgi:hypothetical protein
MPTGQLLRCAVYALLALLWWTVVSPGQAQRTPPAGDEGSSATEQGVKAAFLLNFTKFVEWPAASEQSRANEDFLVCVLGESSIATALEGIFKGETAGGRKVAVRRLAKPGEYCEVLFIPGTERNQAEVLRQAGPGVLTVGEAPSFLQDGGVIRFVVEDRRVRFDVNRGAAERASLRISSRLLRVARSSIRQ